MSIKDDVNYIKNELSSEEKFLESFVKTERFFKKYKKLIFGLIILAIVGSVVFLVKTKLDEKNLYEANIALSNFLENGNQNSLNQLKEKNRDLYEIALYLDAKNEFKNADINLKYLKELIDFQSALLTSNKSDLDTEIEALKLMKDGVQISGEEVGAPTIISIEEFNNYIDGIIKARTLEELESAYSDAVIMIVSEPELTFGNILRNAYEIKKKGLVVNDIEINNINNKPTNFFIFTPYPLQKL